MPRRAKRPYADHTERAREMRRHPSVWTLVGPYNSGQSARTTARHIDRADTLPQYVPRGAYETRVRLTDDGAVLYARYLGGAR